VSSSGTISLRMPYRETLPMEYVRPPSVWCSIIGVQCYYVLIEKQMQYFKRKFMYLEIWYDHVPACSYSQF
jgi:hypothetical protein